MPFSQDGFSRLRHTSSSKSPLTHLPIFDIPPSRKTDSRPHALSERFRFLGGKSSVLTLFDRYLLWRYWHAYIITFLALMGLFVIIDAFSNVDEFARDGATISQIIQGVIQYYAYQGCVFFNAVGGVVTCLASMVVLGTVVKQGELNPVLSAGITTYRIARPMLLGAFTINLLLVADQELLIPSIAHELQLRPGQSASTHMERIQPAHDYSTKILIHGGRSNISSQKIVECEFILPAPQILSEVVTVTATEAAYERNLKQPELSCWRLKGTKPNFQELKLTRSGAEKILPGNSPDEMLIRTVIGFDQVVNGQKIFDYLSTRDLWERVRTPAYGSNSSAALGILIHSRFTKPILNLLMVLMLIPLVVRKESRSLVANLGLATLASTFMLGTTFAFNYLGTSRLIPLDLCGWGPVMLCGAMSAWFSGFVRT